MKLRAGHISTALDVSRSVVLIATPIIATLLLLDVVGTNVADEPFGEFSWPEAINQVGLSAVVMALWAIWIPTALMARMNRAKLLSGLMWAGLTSYWAYQFLTGYFSEPWALN